MSDVTSKVWPWLSLIPSMLYPNDPSIVENTSKVKSSITSTSIVDVVPKLNNFKSALNSIIGLTALDD